MKLTALAIAAVTGATPLASTLIAAPSGVPQGQLAIAPPAPRETGVPPFDLQPMALSADDGNETNTTEGYNPATIPGVIGGITVAISALALVGYCCCRTYNTDRPAGANAPGAAVALPARQADAASEAV